MTPGEKCIECGRVYPEPKAPPVMDGRQRVIAVLAVLGALLLGGLMVGVAVDERNEKQVDLMKFQACVQAGNDPAACRGGQVKVARCVEGADLEAVRCIRHPASEASK